MSPDALRFTQSRISDGLNYLEAIACSKQYGCIMSRRGNPGIAIREEKGCVVKVFVAENDRPSWVYNIKDTVDLLAADWEIAK